MGKRTVELVLGIIGGVLGIISAIAVIFLGGLASALGAGKLGLFVGLIGLIASIAGIVGAAKVSTQRKLGAGILIGSAIVGFASLSIVYVLPTVLFLVSGCLAIFRKAG